MSSVRLDKWLWAARFFKTRALAIKACDLGRIRANGAEVKLVYIEGGLLIVSSGSAMQDGSIGDVVRVRNSDSGVTVTGAVQPDGSIKVGGG